MIKPRRHGLTQREDEILFWVSRGKSNRDIATILQIAVRTVSKHLEHIYPKLGVENRTAAASFAEDRDYI
jgi:DNA-binding CsgD family transcriptional regulator